VKQHKVWSKLESTVYVNCTLYIKLYAGLVYLCAIPLLYALRGGP